MTNFEVFGLGVIALLWLFVMIETRHQRRRELRRRSQQRRQSQELIEQRLSGEWQE